MLIREGVDNRIRWNKGERLSHLFERRCDQLFRDGKPEHLAIITHERQLTFAELDASANQYARYLLCKGIKAGDRVGVLFDKRAETYITLLAIIKLNATFVPLDASFPNDRIEFILHDAQVQTLITFARFAGKLAEFPTACLFIDEARQSIARQPRHRLTNEEAPLIADQLSYIIYTSGTTGKPKGVTIEHAAICNFVNVAVDIYGVTEHDRAYQGMTIAFDFSVEELWVPLIAGATLIPAPSGTSLVGNELGHFLAHHRVSYLAIVPTLLATIDNDLPDLKTLLVSGEACPQKLMERWYTAGRRILNAYGPTEATVTCSLTELHPQQAVTIGAPLPSYTMLILDENEARELAAGETGEIAVAGVGLARDYLKRPELTRKKFIPDFLGLPNNPSQRIYRTGDLGQINAAGEIEFLGRIDTQVKLRGYRIELTEIESLLMQFPQVAQAVVDTWDSAPGQTELVAYYSLHDGAESLPDSEIVEVLRANLPPYMVPAYYQLLPMIPMTASDKADRKALPAPSCTRFVDVSDIVAAATPTEEKLAAILANIMDVGQISVTADFFRELGTHSLLMARFAAAVRADRDLADIAMPDIYQNPSIRQLASLMAATTAKQKQANHNQINQSHADHTLKPKHRRRPLYKPSAWSYYGCGALQVLFTLGYALLTLWLLMAGFKWSYTALTGEWYELAGRLLLFSLFMWVLFAIIPLAAKWLLIGRWQAESFPVWSWRYYRFWLVKALLGVSPLVLLVGSPLYNVYLRLLGAKIGGNVVIESGLPIATDLLTIGDNSVIRKDAIITGYRTESNWIRIGNIAIGNNVYVGVGSVIETDTTMPDNTQLGHASTLHSGQSLQAGKHYHGSPAQETTTEFCPLPTGELSMLRKVLYTLYRILPGLMVIPIVYAAIFYFLPLLSPTTSLGQPVTPDMIFRFDWIEVMVGIALLTLGLMFIGLVLSLLYQRIVPAIFNLFLSEGKVYPLYGTRYVLLNMIRAASNTKQHHILFGDSSAITYYLEWIGYKLNSVFQTGSNFGTHQKHDNPFHCDIGSNTMVADGLSMINMDMSNSTFSVNKVHIGANTYLGNEIHFPHNGKVGNNCLLGTKVMIPIDGELRENTGLLGSPAFEIPRMVEQDQAIAIELDEKERQQQLKGKNRHNLMTVAYYLATSWLFNSIILFLTYAALIFYLSYGFPAIAIFFPLLTLLTLAWFVLLEHTSLGFKSLQPKHVSVYNLKFWQHERYWKFMEHPLNRLRLLNGTPIKNLINALLGIKMGKRVFDDGCMIVEKTLVEIGDFSTLSFASVIQGHSLEEGAFKSDCIKIGTGCTLGLHAFVHYGVQMQDQSLLDANSFLMKGESPAYGNIWRGNPAQPAGIYTHKNPMLILYEKVVQLLEAGMLDRHYFNRKPKKPVLLERLMDEKNGVGTIMKKVKLKPVTKANFEAVLELKVLKEQADFVASNAYSLAEARYYKSYIPKAIYYGKNIVGFLMYEALNDEGRPNDYDIFRLMVDYRYQGQGIGRQALHLALQEITRKPNARQVQICYDPKNPIAKDFYAGFGFIETGLDEDGEMIAVMKLAPPPPEPQQPGRQLSYQ